MREVIRVQEPPAVDHERRGLLSGKHLGQTLELTPARDEHHHLGAPHGVFKRFGEAHTLQRLVAVGPRDRIIGSQSRTRRRESLMSGKAGNSRTSSVSGLKAMPSTVTRGPQDRASVLVDEPHHLVGLGAVDLEHASAEAAWRDRALALAGQRRHVLRQAAAAEAAARLEEARNACGHGAYRPSRAREVGRLHGRPA